MVSLSTEILKGIFVQVDVIDRKTSSLPHRHHICRTCPLARHVSLGSSMVRASYCFLEGCGFDPHRGSEMAQKSDVYLSVISPNSHMRKIYLIKYLSVFSY